MRNRAELRIGAFGVQVIALPPASGDLYSEHDHRHDGQEEIYVVLEGAGEIEVDGEVTALDPDVVVRVGPATRRRIHSGSAGIRVLAVGGTPGRPCEPQPNSVLGASDTLAPTASSSLLAGDRA